jgi:hypothetical protein
MTDIVRALAKIRALPQRTHPIYLHRPATGITNNYYMPDCAYPLMIAGVDLESIRIQPGEERHVPMYFSLLPSEGAITVGTRILIGDSASPECYAEAIVTEILPNSP